MKEQRYGETECSGSDVQWIAVAGRIVSAKYKAYFHFWSIKSYSVIPSFRYSVFRVLPIPSWLCVTLNVWLVSHVALRMWGAQSSYEREELAP